MTPDQQARERLAFAIDSPRPKDVMEQWIEENCELQRTIERQQATITALLADLARLRALEEEQRALTERVQHLLTTIDVERTGRKEAEEEVARLRGALERAALNVWVMRALSQFNNAEALEVLEQDLALHAQDTEVEE